MVPFRRNFIHVVHYGSLILSSYAVAFSAVASSVSFQQGHVQILKTRAVTNTREVDYM